MKDLIEDIRKEFQKVYLLCGEEPYLRQLYKKKLTEAVLPEGDTMNLSVYTGKNVDPKAVIDQAETMPFFVDKRLILLEDTGFFKNASPGAGGLHKVHAGHHLYGLRGRGGGQEGQAL